MNEKLAYLCTKDDPMPAERDMMGQHWIHRDAVAVELSIINETEHVEMYWPDGRYTEGDVIMESTKYVTMKCPHCGITFRQP